jgi:hypothetical protein
VNTVALCNSGILRFEALCPEIGYEPRLSSAFPHLKPKRCHSLTACRLLTSNLRDEAEPFSGILKSDNVDMTRAHARNKGGVPCP